jgi:ribosomal protein L44E
MEAKMPTAVKTECPITLKEFMEHAVPIKVKLGDQEVTLTPRQFEKGSFGFYFNEKTTITINGKPCKMTNQILCTLVNSKEAPRE